MAKCERCGTPVEQRRIAQWFFKITDYAQRLLDNLDDLDWSESTVQGAAELAGSQRRRVRFTFPSRTRRADDSVKRIEVFTTRPDTIFGATYMVLAPEHPPGRRGHDADPQQAAVDAYRDAARHTDLVARQKTDKEKTGVFTGGYCRQSRHRRGHSDLDRRLRADGLRHRARSWRCRDTTTRDFEFATGVRVASNPGGRR